MNSKDIKNALAVTPPEGGLTFIEQLQKLALVPCPKKTAYLIGVSENEKRAILTKAGCKMWNCAECAARAAKTWIARIINGVNRLGGEWSFLTITARGTHRGARSVKALRDGWKRLYNRILYKLKTENISEETLSFCKVWEQHEDGSFHLHILINVCFGTRWAKDQAFSCGLGFMADWRIVDNAGMVAGYIAKYTLKNATTERGGVAIPKGLRRIECSRNWPKLESRKDSNLGWIVKFEREDQLKSANAWHLRGFDIVDLVKETDDNSSND